MCIETSMVMDYNVHQCEGAAMMAATVGGFALQFGTLSHSHLNYCMRKIFLRQTMVRISWKDNV